MLAPKHPRIGYVGGRQRRAEKSGANPDVSAKSHCKEAFFILSLLKTPFLLSQLNLDGRRYSLQATCSRSLSLCFSRYDKVSGLEPRSTLRSSPFAISSWSFSGPIEIEGSS